MTEKEREVLFRKLVERQRDMIWHVCESYSLSAAWETEDAFQEILSVLWRDLESFDGRSSERTWVYRVATNTLLMLKRKASNQPQQTVDVHEMECGTHPTDPLDTEYRHLLQLVGNLGDKDSQIVMAHLHGFNQQEIAQMTGLSLPTVARRMAKAKKWLKKQYNDDK